MGFIGLIAIGVIVILLVVILLIAPFIELDDKYGGFGTLPLLAFYVWIIITVFGLIEHYNKKGDEDE